MSTTEPIALDGCAPAPLLSYLKALGVLRLLADGTNHVRGTAADAAVRGWWEGERFYLATCVDRDRLARFFLEDYAPSPIIAPWNGGSGFYPNDNRDGFAPLTGQVAARFAAIAAVISLAADEIERRNMTTRPEGTDKAEFVAALRDRLPDSALAWLDATVVLSGARLNFPQLLGTGGNDGRLEFTNNFMRRLVAPRNGLFDATTGAPKATAERLLHAALFAAPSQGLLASAVGQFDPGAAGGANGTVGYEGNAHVNPWDYVLALEGAIMFGGAATRRHEGARDSAASFPFTVRATGAGWGGVTDTDTDSARAEFWAPLWHRPAGAAELARLFREGRAVLDGRTARDGLDFARAAAGLGTSRGLSAFQRYSFVMRLGKNYLAAPLGIRSVAPAQPVAAQLINDLDHAGWLSRVRRLAQDRNSPARARQILKRLQDALFTMSETHVSPPAVQSALIGLGDLGLWLSRSPDARDRVSPPPLLSAAWSHQADDGTPEFRVAVALASLGWRYEPSSAEARSGAAPTEGVVREPAVTLASHFAPIAPEPPSRRFRVWDATTNANRVIWGAGDLITNMIAVLEQRLISSVKDKPLNAAAPARLQDVEAFLAPEFDALRCARLISGLIWARPAHLWRAPERNGHGHLPFAYAALKLLFVPEHSLIALAQRGLVPPHCTIPLPPGLLTRLRSGRVDAVVHAALARAQASGIGSPFRGGTTMDQTTNFGVGVDGSRLAAALLIPVDEFGLRTLVERAYPKDKEHIDA